MLMFLGKKQKITFYPHSGKKIKLIHKLMIKVN